MKVYPPINIYVYSTSRWENKAFFFASAVESVDVFINCLSLSLSLDGTSMKAGYLREIIIIK